MEHEQPPAKKAKKANKLNVLYVSHGPEYPKGVIQLPHPGEYDDVFSTCNLEFEHSEDGTLLQIMEDECACTDGVSHGGGFDTGAAWKYTPHTVYIDSDVWKNLSAAQKTTVISHANLECKTCGNTNQVYITDVFDKAWASD